MVNKRFVVASALCVAWSGLAMAQTPPPSQEASMPDAKQHLVKAPKIDFEHLRDPFESYLKRVATRGKRLLEEQQSKLANRKRDPLEVFDLSTLSLVGIFKMGEHEVAMVQDSQGKGYTVHVGDYMGKKNGKIVKIDGSTVYLLEKGVDIEGNIVDRPVTLTLKEVND